MPVYEYKCLQCGKLVEILHIGGQTKARCPDCGSSKLKKQFSVFSPKVNQGQSKRCYGCTDSKCPHSGV